MICGGEKKKTATVPDEKSHGLGTQRKDHHTRKKLYFRQFWVKEQRCSKNYFRRKVLLPLLYRASITPVRLHRVAFVPFPFLASVTRARIS